MVVWKVTEHVNDLLGLGGLEFWLKSLKAHLPPPPPSSGSKPLYSIIVVGTHIDELKGPEMTRPLREARLRELFNDKCEMGNLPFEYVEISSKLGTNVPLLRDKIISSALGHSYMGELVPKSYLRVEAEVMRRRERRKGGLPLVDLRAELLPAFPEMREDEVMRAIELLHAWGICVHFDSAVFAQLVVVDPPFLTQEVLSALFHPDYANYFPDGRLKHKDLRLIWPGYQDRAEFLLALMEKFEVCFELDQEPKPAFWERQSVITSYLPEEPPAKEFNKQVWPDQCPPRTSELRRLYQFNIIPKELVSRLLVRLHSKMEEKALWRTGLFLESLDHQVKVLMRANIWENTLEAVIRGADLEVAREILKIISTEIDLVARNYAGITLKFEDTVLNNSAGATKKKWWELAPTQQWITKEAKASGTSAIHLLSCYAGGVSKNDELVGKLKVALWGCGGSLDDVKEAFALHNPYSQQSFESHRVLLVTRHITAPSLFKRDHWKSMDHASVRAEGVALHTQHSAKFAWNSGELLPVSLMTQGTTSEAAWSIAQGGFGVVATEKDQGWYGRGIYTTSSLKFASRYAQQKVRDFDKVKKPTEPSKEPVLLLCAVLPGNVFPVAEVDKYYGHSGVDGYQSHLAIGNFRPPFLGEKQCLVSLSFSPG